MDIENDIYINQLAQDIIPKEEGNRLFNNLKPDCQLIVLRRIVFFILQAGARGMDVKPAIENCTKVQKIFKKKGFIIERA